ncbi:unnamed protein product [Ectocarpus sp. CCAP 1310/34]|nr:unnamed protein product [Ectocarpus sp. CCAP 1310/34]
MGAGASADLSKDQLKEIYADVKHRLYPHQQTAVETLFESSENAAEILECVNTHLNDAEVPNMDYETKPDFTDKHVSLMSKHLTPELFTQLKAAGATSKGYTISRAIQTGVMTPHLGVGITAGDEESWALFKDIYFPIIKGWHQFDPETQSHASDLDASKLTMTDEQVAMFNEFVVSTRIRAARNVSGYALPAGTDDEDRKKVREVLCGAFEKFEGELAGKFYDLGALSDKDRNTLLSNGFLFQIPKTTNLLWHAGAAKNWPTDRGIFHNESKTVLCWVNEEDHCRIISMEDGGNVKSVFTRFAQISEALKTAAEANGTKLMYCDKLGFLGTCPSNLGTGLRASVMIKLPKFNETEESRQVLEQVCDKFDLQPRGSAGEHSAAVEDKFDVSNKQRIGFTEVQLVQKMIDGVTQVISFEKAMAAGEKDLSAVKGEIA